MHIPAILRGALAGLALVPAVALCDAFSQPAAAQAGAEAPVDVIVAQIRRQGFVCDEPSSATRDPQLSRPDERAWVLKCANASYRVRLIPDMAAKVETLN